MRLDVSAAGAVAYGLLVAGAAARTTPATMMEAREGRRIKFTDFSEYLSRSNSTMIQWTFQDGNSGINVTHVSLHRIDNNGQLVRVVGEGQKQVPAHDSPGKVPINHWKPGNQFFEATDEQGPGDMSVGTRDQDSEMLTFPYATEEEEGGSATLVENDVHFGRYMDDQLINAALCLSVGWERDLQAGRTYSHAFVITEDSDLSGPLFQKLNETVRKASYLADYEGPDVTPVSPWAAASSSSSPSSSDPNNGGGLSVAAQAGIGVGAGIAGLLLVGGLVFFFFCRRRRRRGPKPSYYGRGAGAAFASDSGVAVRGKEMAGASQSGPHSLYASDPGRLHEHDAPAAAPAAVGDLPGVGVSDPRHSGYGGGAGGGGGRRSRSSSSSSSNRRRTISNSGDPRYSGYGGGGGGGGDDIGSYRAEPAPGGRATTTTTTTTTTDYAPSRPTSEVRSPSRYAHLIEEGMTPDEIQRLEEEERQLDAAIENAGRGSRAA